MLLKKIWQDIISLKYLIYKIQIELKFYKRFIINKNVEWSSSESVLEPGQKKSDFDKDPVLDRMELQLKKSGLLKLNLPKILILIGL